MEFRARLALGLSLSFLVACGGGDKPAATPSDSTLAESSSGAKPPPVASGKALPPGALQVAKGVRAFDAGKYQVAVEAFTAAMRENPSDAEAAFDLGQAQERLGDRPAAIVAYRKAIELNPSLESASAALSSVLIDQGDFDGAIAVCRAGMAADATTNGKSVPLTENLGVALASKGDSAGARKALESAVAGASPDPQALLTLGHWLGQWKSPDAKGVLLRAASVNGNDVGMLAAVGLELRVTGAFKECVGVFDKAVNVKDGGEVRTERALCKLGLKDDAGALSDLEAAVTNEPTFAAGHFYLGGRRASSGKMKEAAAEFEAYLKLAPTGSLANAAKERLAATKSAH